MAILSNASTKVLQRCTGSEGPFAPLLKFAQCFASCRHDALRALGSNVIVAGGTPRSVGGEGRDHIRFAMASESVGRRRQPAPAHLPKALTVSVSRRIAPGSASHKIVCSAPPSLHDCILTSRRAYACTESQACHQTRPGRRLAIASKRQV